MKKSMRSTPQLAGQGIAICSDVVVSHDSKPAPSSRRTRYRLPGYGFYLVYVAPNPNSLTIEAFSVWIRSMMRLKDSSNERSEKLADMPF